VLRAAAVGDQDEADESSRVAAVLGENIGVSMTGEKTAAAAKRVAQVFAGLNFLMAAAAFVLSINLPPRSVLSSSSAERISPIPSKRATVPRMIFSHQIGSSLAFHLQILFG